MILCPVCNQPMVVTGLNPNIYQCQRIKVLVPELNTKVDNIHAQFYVEPLTQKITYKVIELGAYSFTISDDFNKKSTVVSCLKEIPRKPKQARSFERKTILKLDSAIDLPWNDREKVFERLKLYLL